MENNREVNYFTGVENSNIIEWENYLDSLEKNLTQEDLGDAYEDLKSSPLERMTMFFTQIGCTHKHSMLVKFKLVHSLVPHHVGTALEYQYVRLCLSEQYWKCSHCGKHFPLAQPVGTEL